MWYGDLWLCGVFLDALVGLFVYKQVFVFKTCYEVGGDELGNSPVLSFSRHPCRSQTRCKLRYFNSIGRRTHPHFTEKSEVGWRV